MIPETDQAHLVLSFKTFPRLDKRNFALMLINTILGDTMSSWLFTEVREKRGLAYYVGTEYSDFYDTGVFMAYAGVDLKRLNEAIEVICSTVGKIKNGVSEKDLAHAKENFKGRLYLGLEDSRSIASYISNYELLWGEIVDPDTLIAEIAKVTNFDIINVANELFIEKKANLTIISPHGDNKQFEETINI